MEESAEAGSSRKERERKLIAFKKVGFIIFFHVSIVFLNSLLPSHKQKALAERREKSAAKVKITSMRLVSALIVLPSFFFLPFFFFFFIAAGEYWRGSESELVSVLGQA
jgi:hypothetical protein